MVVYLTYERLVLDSELSTCFRCWWHGTHCHNFYKRLASFLSDKLHQSYTQVIH